MPKWSVSFTLPDITIEIDVFWTDDFVEACAVAAIRQAFDDLEYPLAGVVYTVVEARP